VGLAKRHSTSLHTNIYDFVRQVLNMELADKAREFSSEGDPEKFKQAVEIFAMKFQQFTGPVMAKSVEDTVFYRYNRFIGLNEVGGEPQKFGGTVSTFHHQNQQRQLRRPYELLSTSTHDTKRSEDVRARLAVLSEVPEIWQERVSAWTRFNRSRKIELDEEMAPDANDEYLIYQTIVGACPLSVGWSESMAGSGSVSGVPTGSDTGSNTGPDTGAGSGAGTGSGSGSGSGTGAGSGSGAGKGSALTAASFNWKPFSSRVEQYVLKAAREGKGHTSWINQNQAYENALVGFVQKILTPSGTNPFLDDFVEFHRGISRLGLINSLTQTLLKVTVPGVPDIYQGCELWDFSLVDPDNRRAVDYQLRGSCLSKLLSTMPTQSAVGMGTKSEAVSAAKTAAKTENLPSGAELSQRKSLVDECLADWNSGLIKQLILTATLRYRAENPDLFKRGHYLPLEIEGPGAEHVIAFARVHGNQVAIVVAPLMVAAALSRDKLVGAFEQSAIGRFMSDDLWRDTTIILPTELKFNELQDLFTLQTHKVQGSQLSLSDIFQAFPVGLLTGNHAARSR